MGLGVVGGLGLLIDDDGDHKWLLPLLLGDLADSRWLRLLFVFHNGNPLRLFGRASSVDTLIVQLN